MESEKRGTPRIQPFVAACTVHEGNRRLSGYLLDLSAKGARVSCDEPLTRGTESVTLEVRFSRRTASSRLPARVQWAQIGTKNGEAAIFGVTFEGANPEELGVLEDVIAEFQRQAALLAESAPVSEPSRRQPWKEGGSPDGGEFLGLHDDELIHRIDALPTDHSRDLELLEVVRSDRHFFVRQEAAKRIRDAHLLKEHSGDRHIGQILVRGMTRAEDRAYLEKLVAETRHLEVRKAAEAQLRVVAALAAKTP